MDGHGGQPGPAPIGGVGRPEDLQGVVQRMATGAPVDDHMDGHGEQPGPAQEEGAGCSANLQRRRGSAGHAAWPVGLASPATTGPLRHPLDCTSPPQPGARARATGTPWSQSAREMSVLSQPSPVDEPRDACMCAEFAFVRGVEWHYV